MTKVRDVNEIINFFSSVLEHRVGEAPVVAGAPNLKRFLAEDTRWPIKGFDGTTNPNIKFEAFCCRWRVASSVISAQHSPNIITFIMVVNRRKWKGSGKKCLPISDALPTCQIWQKNIPPFACTASTTGFQASTCALVQIPGVCGIKLIP